MKTKKEVKRDITIEDITQIIKELIFDGSFEIRKKIMAVLESNNITTIAQAKEEQYAALFTEFLKIKELTNKLQDNIKCKYMFCSNFCNEYTGNNEIICKHTKTKSFNFELFWKENFESNSNFSFKLSFFKKKFHIEIFKSETEDFHDCFVGESLIDVCNIVLKSIKI